MPVFAPPVARLAGKTTMRPAARAIQGPHFYTHIGAATPIRIRQKGSAMTMRRKKPLRRASLKRSPMKRKARRGGAMPPEVYRTVMETRARGECELALPSLCTGRAEEWHHRQRRQRANDTVSNGLAACHACHHYITHVSPAVGRAAGFIVHSHHPDPGQVPVYWRGSWWLLTDDGQRVLADAPDGGQGA